MATPPTVVIPPIRIGWAICVGVVSCTIGGVMAILLLCAILMYSPVINMQLLAEIGFVIMVSFRDIR